MSSRAPSGSPQSQSPAGVRLLSTVLVAAAFSTIGACVDEPLAPVGPDGFSALGEAPQVATPPPPALSSVDHLSAADFEVLLADVLSSLTSRFPAGHTTLVLEVLGPPGAERALSETLSQRLAMAGYGLASPKAPRTAADHAVTCRVLALGGGMFLLDLRIETTSMARLYGRDASQRLVAQGAFTQRQ
jgi:hypothetical protein